MDPDEPKKIAGELREHLKEKCLEAHLNGEWDGCNATWQVVLLAPGEVLLDPGTIIETTRNG